MYFGVSLLMDDNSALRGHVCVHGREWGAARFAYETFAAGKHMTQMGYE